MSKKSGKTKDDQIYDLRDVVLAKIRGYPSWPAMVVDPEGVPSAVQKERPTSKKTTFYCVRFFPVGDYSWVLAKDLSKLKTHEIEAYINEPHKKNGDLLSGYKIALDPATWEAGLEAKRQDDEEAEAEAEVDELEGEDEVDEDKPAKIKKRKRESEAAPKAKPKVKKEKGSVEPAGKKRKATSENGGGAAKGVKGKKNGTKSKAMVESEDEGDRAGADDAGPSKATPPPAKKAKRDKDGEEGDADLENDPEAQKVKEWRHKLQRGFLGKGPPREDDIAQYDGIFTTVEDFDMNIKYLQFSKIGKVMRHIAALEGDKIPRDAEFKFKDRAQALVNKWHQTISTNKPNGTNGTVDEPLSRAPAAKDEGEDMEVDKAEVSDAPAAAESAEPGATELAADTTMKETVENANVDYVDSEMNAEKAKAAAMTEKDAVGDVAMTEA